MKKVISLMLVIFLFVSVSDKIWAMNETDAILGGSLMLGGLTLMLVPIIFNEGGEWGAFDYLAVGVGGAAMIGGLIWFIFALLDDNNYYAQGSNNSIIRHVRFDITPTGRMYFGVRFRLD
ncbi:MAG: hypothetical protein FWD13_06990 [Treponema sp.]|nr:hypothetical protein [Treponema sp.]